MGISLNTAKSSDTGALSLPADSGSYLRRQSSRAVKKSKKGNHWLRITLLLAGNVLLLLLLCVMGFEIYQYVFYSPRFDLKQVTFSGSRFANIENLKGALEQGFPKNLICIDLAKLRRVVERDPWVLHCQVRRVLPDMLIIDLQERQPAALAGIQDSIHVVDQEGKILDRYSARYGKFDLPLVKGLAWDDHGNTGEANHRRMILFLQAMADLDSQGDQFTRLISEADVSDDQDLIITPLDDTVRIHLGRQDFLKRFRIHQEKLSLYKDMKEKYGGIDSIDLRYEKQIVYQPMSGEENAAPLTAARNP
jgi:cell division protein FtsQ